MITKHWNSPLNPNPPECVEFDLHAAQIDCVDRVCGEIQLSKFDSRTVFSKPDEDDDYTEFYYINDFGENVKCEFDSTVSHSETWDGFHMDSIGFYYQACKNGERVRIESAFCSFGRPRTGRGI